MKIPSQEEFLDMITDYWDFECNYSMKYLQYLDFHNFYNKEISNSFFTDKQAKINLYKRISSKLSIALKQA